MCFPGEAMFAFNSEDCSLRFRAKIRMRGSRGSIGGPDPHGNSQVVWVSIGIQKIILNSAVFDSSAFKLEHPIKTLPELFLTPHPHQKKKKKKKKKKIQDPCVYS